MEPLPLILESEVVEEQAKTSGVYCEASSFALPLNHAPKTKWEQTSRSENDSFGEIILPSIWLGNSCAGNPISQRDAECNGSRKHAESTESADRTSCNKKGPPTH